VNPNALRGQIQGLERKFAGLQIAWEASHQNQPPFKPGRQPQPAPAAPEREYLSVTLSDGRTGMVVTYTADDRFLVQLDDGMEPWVGDPDSANPDPGFVVTSRWLTADLIASAH
jgi:hypothetical protein